MTEEVAKLFAWGLTIAIGVTGPAIAIGIIAGSAVEAIGRNPELENKIRSNMILGITFAESLAIFALLAAIMIKFVF